MSQLKAYWSISLSVECPSCGHEWDETNNPDFWGNAIEPCEHGTKASKNFDFTCPECEEEFKADLEY